MEISRSVTSSTISGKVGCAECGAKELRLTWIKLKDGFVVLLCNKCERELTRKLLESYGAI